MVSRLLHCTALRSRLRWSYFSGAGWPPPTVATSANSAGVAVQTASAYAKFSVPLAVASAYAASCELARVVGGGGDGGGWQAGLLNGQAPVVLASFPEPGWMLARSHIKY